MTCPKCGTDNPLGRVFCGACGAKLDLRRVDEDLGRLQEKRSTSSRWGCLFVLVPVILLLVVIGLALWPDTGRLGDPGESRDGRRAQVQIRALQRLTPGSTLSATFRERDLNAYFRYYKAKRFGLASLTFDVGDGRVRTRLVRRLGVLRVGPLRVVSALSLDVVMEADGGAPALQGAAIGHLPLPGILGAPVAAAAAGCLEGDRDWALVVRITELNAGQDRLVATVRK